MTGDLTKPASIVRMKPSQFFWFFVGLLLIAIIAAGANAVAQAAIAKGRMTWEKNKPGEKSATGAPTGLRALLPGV